MGQFLQSPDPAIKLARQYGIRGLFSPDLIPSLQPVTIIDDLTGGISNEPQRIAVARVSIAGVAAEFSVARFETPPNVICHITQLLLRTETDDVIFAHFGSSVAAPATLVQGTYTDGRLRGAGQQAAGILGGDTYGTNATPAQFDLIGEANKGDLELSNVDWVIGRTDGFFDFVEIACSTVDLDFFVSMRWREYDAVEVR